MTGRVVGARLGLVPRCLGAALVVAACTASESTPRVAVGAPAPAYRTRNLEGDSVSIADQRGRVILLNVWATWCHPCRDEIPELRAIRARYAAGGFEVIGVSVDAAGTDGTITEFAREFDMQYPIWRDPEERISAQYLVVGVPATFLIDRGGILRWRHLGPIALGDTTLANAIVRALDDGARSGN